MGSHLRGMTWSHPRAYDPLLAVSAHWAAQTDVRIDWSQRSLQDFESQSVQTVARQYDLIIIDHPHIGQAVSEGSLARLDVPRCDQRLRDLRAAAVGASCLCYAWKDAQYALPIDAAAQVQAWHQDLLSAPLTHWDEVVQLGQQRRLLMPLRAPHALMCFCTLAANLGVPCSTTGPAFIPPGIGKEIYDRLLELASLLDDSCFSMDPITALDMMAAVDSGIACIPLVFGYSSYSRVGFRPHLIRFADIPALGTSGPCGSVLGGTGIAVSATSASIDDASDFAYWVTSRSIQKELYATSGGQPAHSEAWASKAVNMLTNDFYRLTRATLESAWVRPRHNGYMSFQRTAGLRLQEALRSRERPRKVIHNINDLFHKSFAT
jgi:multiple sugar transport system substrate-binding protein